MHWAISIVYSANESVLPGVAGCGRRIAQDTTADPIGYSEPRVSVMIIFTLLIYLLDDSRRSLPVCGSQEGV